MRSELRAHLLEIARQDPAICAAAITGSAATGTEDAYSDVDLAFAVTGDRAAAVDAWTRRMYAEHHALHHLDFPAGAWLYRVFLLPGPLQVDLAFVPRAEFRPLAPSFRLVFGESQPLQEPPLPSADSFIGFAWLYAIHVRTSIARGHLWQAEYMLSGLRTQGLSLACLRHGLPPAHGRGYARLPEAVTEPWKATLPAALSAAELARAFRAALSCLQTELDAADPALALRLAPALQALARDGVDHRYPPRPQ